MPMRMIPPVRSNRPATPFSQYMSGQAPTNAASAATGGLSQINSVAQSRAPSASRATLRLNQAVRQTDPDTVNQQDFDQLVEQYGGEFNRHMQRGGSADGWAASPQFRSLVSQHVYDYIPGMDDDMLRNQQAMQDDPNAQAYYQQMFGNDPNFQRALMRLTNARTTRRADIAATAPITDANDPGYLAWVQQQQSDPANISAPDLGLYGSGSSDTSLDAYNRYRADQRTASGQRLPSQISTMDTSQGASAGANGLPRSLTDAATLPRTTGDGASSSPTPTGNANAPTSAYLSPAIRVPSTSDAVTPTASSSRVPLTVRPRPLAPISGPPAPSSSSSSVTPASQSLDPQVRANSDAQQSLSGLPRPPSQSSSLNSVQSTMRQAVMPRDPRPINRTSL